MELFCIFAGGCFWCMQPAFDQLPGVIKTEVGYSGGFIENPTYQDVITDQTGHVEAIRIVYNPAEVQYETLVQTFWENIDPTTENQQFADKGEHYQTVIFYTSPDQERIARASKKALEDSKKFDKPIVTKILPASEFYPAEDYHQKYYQKNPVHYMLYKKGSGRQDYIEKTWKKPHEK